MIIIFCTYIYTPDFRENGATNSPNVYYPFNDKISFFNQKTTIRTIPEKEMLDLNFELCPLHSPLLWTSKFISFPPVIEML
jgi:hypothetical protein